MANTSTVHIKTDFDCKVFDYGQELGTTKADTYFNIELRKGEHELTFVYTEDESISKSISYIVEEADCDYRLNAEMVEAIYRKAKEYEDLFYETEEFAREAYNLYQKAAEKGHVEAQFNLGEIYKNGAILDFVFAEHAFNPQKEEDLIKAVEWYTKAAKQGHTPAQYELGDCYYYGKGVDKDLVKAVEWYTKAAELGNVDAQYSLGYCYYYGIGVKADITKAIEWDTKAAVQGNAYAQCNLGDYYKRGYGVEKDLTISMEWYAKAAEQGNATAQSQLGDYYYYGIGIEEDISKAIDWYNKAAEQGDANALDHLGCCYADGVGIEKDFDKAMELFTQATETEGVFEGVFGIANCYLDAVKGDADAQCDLGERYYDGDEYVRKNLTKAVKWYTKAAEQGHAVAQCYLGFCYADGVGIEKDLDKALRWFTQATETEHMTVNEIANCYLDAIKGNTDAQFDLGNRYYYGYDYVRKNLTKAVEWYTKAAEQGHAKAQFNLGLCYEYGIGVEKDLIKAMEWYTKASKHGYEKAKERLLSIKNNLNQSKKRESTTPDSPIPHYLFFDTETTGIPKDYNAPTSNSSNWPRLVQLSWITTDENCNVLSQNDFIIYPDGFIIPSDASKLHGITTAIAKEKGKPLKEVMDKFIEDFKAAKVIVGHNIAFDKKIVGAELIRLGQKDIMNNKQSFCTMEAGTDYCKIRGYYGYKWPKLQELYKKLFGYEFEDAHNSMSDVTATLKCFKEMRKRGLI